MQVFTDLLHGKIAFSIVAVDILLGHLHRLSGGIRPLTANLTLHPQAPLQAPGPQLLRRGKVRRPDRAGEIRAEHLLQRQVRAPGQLHEARQKLQEKQAALGHGLAGLPQPSYNLFHRRLHLGLAAQLHRRGQGPLVGFVKGEPVAGVRLQVSDVDRPAHAHNPPVFQSIVGAGGGLGKARRFGAGRSHTYGDGQPQIVFRQGTHPVHRADIVVNGDRSGKGRQHGHGIVIQKDPVEAPL